MKKLLSILLVVTMLLSMMPFAVFAAETDDSVTRLSGKGRCDTAIAAAETLKEVLGVDSFSSIIIANGSNFADALAGSYLAAKKSAPILLYQKSAVAQNTAYILNNLAPGGTVYLLGGKAAVPEDMEKNLLDNGVNVMRLAGKSRYDTNLAILEEVPVGSGQEVLVATAYNFADSLSASATGLPILLVDSKGGKLQAAQKDYLAGLSDCKLTIIGGAGAVSEGLKEQLGEYGEVTRLAGKDRYATSTLIAETYFKDVDTIVVAYGRNFPDGLCGGPLAYAVGAPLILTQANSENAASSYVEAHQVSAGYILGGTGALSESTVNKVFENKSEPDPHKHSYTTVVTAPTCTEGGYTTYTCACGHSYKADEVKALGHSWNDGVVTKEPTETTEGVKTYTCTVCGETKNESIPVKDHVHNYTSVVTAPTCTEGGYTTYTCACGHSYKADEVKALGHSWNDGVVTKEPTETTEGVKTYTCTRCGETKTESIPVKDHVHNYTSVVTAPTCTEDGYTTYTCACGDSYKADEVAAPGHKEESVPALEATCTEAGKTEGAICAVCGEVLKAQEEVPALGHEPGEAVEENRVEATTSAAGKYDKVVYCTRCDAEISRETVTIPKLDRVRIGLVTDEGGINDQAYNQAIWEGLNAVKDAEKTVEVAYLVSETEADYETNIQTFIDDDWDLIICSGYALADACRKAALEYPNQKFAIMDDTANADLPNVACLTFAAEQAAYLAGVAAGTMTESNVVGYVQAMVTPNFNLYGIGFIEGVLSVNPDATVLQYNANSIADVAAGEAAVDHFVSEGADVVFHAAGGTGIGVISGAQKHGIYVIGVDVDQSHMAPDVMLTSAIKDVREAAKAVALGIVNDEFVSGERKLDVSHDAVDIVLPGLLSEDAMAAVAKAKNDLLTGKVVVPVNAEDCPEFLLGKSEEPDPPADPGDFHIDIKFSNVFFPEEVLGQASEKLAAMITERTGGAVTVTYYGQNQLDCYGDSVAQANMGANWMGLEEPSLFANYVGDCAVLIGPMLYATNDEYNYIMDSELVGAIKDKLAKEHNIRIIDTHYSFGFRQVYTNKIVTEPADLNGQVLRATSSALFAKTLECLGATPQAMGFTEAISAMANGVVQGYEGSISTHMDTGVYEFIHNAAMTNHLIATRWLFISENVWQTIPAEYREIISSAALECGIWAQEATAAAEAETIAFLQTEGTSFNSVDLDQFTVACEPVHTWIAREYGADPDLHTQLIEMVKAYRVDHPVPAPPAAGIIAQGTCGTNATWTLDSTGVMTVTGTGEVTAPVPGEGTWDDVMPKVKKLVIGSGVTSVGDRAFFYTSEVTEIVLPDTLTTINDAAFDFCMKLTGIKIPDSVTTIGASAFAQCYALTEVKLPPQLTVISPTAFEMSGLEVVHIPAGVTEIGKWAFDSCPLKEIYFAGTEAQWNNISGIDELAGILVHFAQ